ncbi:MAG TPA: fibronectin type III domain-containing protein, partial [Candidatus Edwardsbacteria bacterium]|nr:fibronectin type III domain-containing protein [Candidatus Edwardsbacteria bacterium]
MRIPCIAVLALLLAAATAAPARGVEPPGRFTAADTPDDDGTSITLEWQLSPSDTGTALAGYAVYRSIGGRDSFQQISLVPRGNALYHDTEVDTKINYFYKIAAVDKDGQQSAPAESGPVRTQEQRFKVGKINALIG